jgi:hypothetical protein
MVPFFLRIVKIMIGTVPGITCVALLTCLVLHGTVRTDDFRPPLFIFFVLNCVVLIF